MMKKKQIGLESPISFADLLEESQEPAEVETEPPSLPDLRSEDTYLVDDNNDDSNSELLVATTTKHLLQISDIDESFLNNTMDSFCRNLKNSIQEQFLSSRERLFRQTENEINSITTVYQDTLNNREVELNNLKINYSKLSDEFNNLNVEFGKMQTSYGETKKKLSCVRKLSQTVMKWKNECDKKRFIQNYVNNTIIPNKNKIKIQNIYYFWKNKALTQHHSRYDEIWQKRLETVSKKIIEQYELNINSLRDQLNIKTHELQQLHNERTQQQQNMKRAFMRGVSALNLEAMSLFNNTQTSTTLNINHNKENNSDNTQPASHMSSEL
eukprot:231048_1